MKNKSINQIKKSALVFASCCLSFASLAQSHVTMSLQHITSTKNTIEYDLYIVNDGTTNLKLAGCSYGVNFNPSILHGEEIVFNYDAKSKVRSLDGLKSFSIASLMKGDKNQLKIISTPISESESPLLIRNSPMKIGRFSIQCKKEWTHNSTPDFQLQSIAKLGLTTTQVAVFEDNKSTMIALTPTQGNVAVEVVGNPILNPMRIENELHTTLLETQKSENATSSTLFETKLKLFPNPGSDKIHLSFDVINSERIHIQILDFQGRIVKQILTDIHEGNNTIQLDINTLSKGIYSVKLKGESGLNLNQTFTKQ